MELEQLYKNVVRVESELKTLTAIAGEKNKEELADLNVSQMDEGLRSDGKKIVPQYSPNYAKFKGFKTPNLKLTGDFHSGVFVERKGDKLLFDSTDKKTDKLESRYSSNIFGIAPKNEQKAADELDEDLLKLVEIELEKGIL
jgi:hypothetical protein